MATSTVGTAELVAALAGGGDVENAAYAQMANRILDAQNKQAMLDKRVLDANLQRDIMRSRGNFERNSMDLPDMVRFAALGDMADQLKYGQEAIGQSQKNKGMADIQKMAQDAAAAGKDPADVINMIVSAISGKHLGPGNVRVDEQARADIGATQALEGERKTSSLFNMARAAAEGATNPAGVPKVEGISDFHEGMLWQNPDQIPVTVGSGWFDGIPEQELNLPLSDPRAQKVWTGMGQEERNALMTDLGPDFLKWRQANIATRPELADASLALGIYLSEMGSDPTTANAPEPGKEGVGKNRRGVYDPATGTIQWND